MQVTKLSLYPLLRPGRRAALSVTHRVLLIQAQNLAAMKDVVKLVVSFSTVPDVSTLNCEFWANDIPRS